MTEVEAKSHKRPCRTAWRRWSNCCNAIASVRMANTGRTICRSSPPNYDQGQILAELQRKLDELHPADVAHILEALPLEERLTVWQLVKAERDGDILLEVSDAVRETLIADMDDHELLAAAKEMDADELADLAPELPVMSFMS